MDKYLSDSEILRWNDRLFHQPFSVRARYGNGSSLPMIVFKQKIKEGGPYSPEIEVDTLAPTTKFTFSFSIPKGKIEDFFDTFNNWFEEKIGTKTLFEEQDKTLAIGVKQRASSIEVSHSIVSQKKQEDHIINQQEYTKFTYLFSGKLCSIMAYVMFLEDSIDIFSQIWGQDEAGKDKALTKFVTGDIVNKKGNSQDDYLVTALVPRKTGSKFIIDYSISKMITKGQILYWDQSEVYKEEALISSRDARINDILAN